MSDPNQLAVYHRAKIEGLQPGESHFISIKDNAQIRKIGWNFPPFTHALAEQNGEPGVLYTCTGVRNLET